MTRPKIDCGAMNRSPVHSYFLYVSGPAIDGTKSDFVAILQVSVSGKDAIDLYSVR
jgi:hypothetical protein